MNKLIFKIFLFIAFVSVFHNYAHSVENRKADRLFVMPSFGLNFPITSLSKGEFTDDLLGYDNNTFYWQFFSVAYFFGDIGIDFFHFGSIPRTRQDHRSLFSEKVYDVYSENYFLDLSTYSDNSASPLFTGVIDKVCIGPAYKYEHDKFIIIGRTSLGIVAYDTYSGDLTLKEKGSNNIFNIDWSSTPSECFTFNPAVTFGYRLSSNFALGLDINYWIYQLDIEFKETSTNEVTNEITTKTYRYSDLINEISIGLNLMFIPL